MSNLPKSILYPVDFSRRCDAVTPAVAEMAASLKVPVVLFYSMRLGGIDEAALQKPPFEREAVRERFRHSLNLFPFPALPRVQREVADGPAAAEIVKRAERMDAPLIMMPTRGHTRFRQLLLGSVTAAVLHDAPGPVWTEAHTADDGSPPGVPHRAIVCAIDLGPQTATLLRMASAFSAHFGVPFHAVHWIPAVDARFRSRVADQAHEYLIFEARRKFPEHAAQAGGDMPLEIIQEHELAAGVAGAIVRHGADLLVIGRGVILGTLGRLRTSAHELIRRSRCPVLSV